MASKRSLGLRPRSMPTAADSPYEQLDHPERAILKVVEAGKQQARYVTIRPDDKGFNLTSDAEEALRFRFDPESDPKLFECVANIFQPPHLTKQDRKPYSWLALQWQQENPSFGRGSTRIAENGEVTSIWKDSTAG
ncbi:hypothetical protein FRC00_008665 [Tulasnella sp. 408]|nr:hypothetical protein FRC00_008665 [Tulasnella sp. 408]